MMNKRASWMMESKPIKVAHVLNSVGGVDVHMRIILPHLDPTVIENLIIHSDSDTSEPFLDRNSFPLEEYTLPIQREISPIKDFNALLRLIRILKKEKPDLIHAHSSKGGIIARAATLWYKSNVLYTPHAFSYLSASSRFKRGIYLGFERFFKRFNSILLACSNSERERGLNEVGYKPARALTFNNSISPIEPDLVGSPELNLPKEYICSVGRPSYQKNIEMMIEVIRELRKKTPNIFLVLMGVGEYSPNKEQVLDLVRKYQLEENVKFIPWIERERIFSIINGSSLYISTARYEGLPYSVIEAIALGKPCVVTNCDGNRDLIKDGYNGFVVDENSVDRMANCIFTLLNDDTLRAKFEKNALTYFNENFNIEQNISELEIIYRKFAKK